MKRYAACLNIVRFFLLSLNPDLVILFGSTFLRSKAVFKLRSFSHETTIAAGIERSVVELNLEFKSKPEFVLTHYHCHGRGPNKQSDDLKVNALPLYKYSSFSYFS